MDNIKKRDRSQKTRPQNAAALVESLTSGSLDNRTRHAAAIVAARDVIDAAPCEAGRALMVSALSAWAVAESSCLAELSRAKDVLCDGELAPIFETLQRVQNNILRLTQAIAALEDKALAKAKPGGKTTLDIATLLSDEVDS